MSGGAISGNTASYGGVIYGPNTVTITIPVPTTGYHFIDIGYRKDGSQNTDSDCAWFKVIQ
jgi:predicted outer membrane repeat protein